MKSWIARGLILDEIQKIPLRHEAEKLAARRQVSQIRERDKFIADLPADLSDFLMRTFEKLFDQTKFVDDFERGWMNRVATEIAKKISMLLEDDHWDAR